LSVFQGVPLLGAEHFGTPWSVLKVEKFNH